MYDDREKAVIRWAESLTENTTRDDDNAFLELKKYFNEQDIVELLYLPVCLMRGIVCRMYSRMI